MSDDTRKHVIDCLVEFMGLGERPVFTDASWLEDFGLNSLSLFHALLHIEKRLGLAFSEDELTLENIEDFGDLVRMVDRLRLAAANECG